MKKTTQIAALLLAPGVLFLASCNTGYSGESTAQSTKAETGSFPFDITEMATFDEPWAMAFEPGTGRLFITEKGGALKIYQPSNGKTGTVTSGMPAVAYGGQGGLGDIAFAPDYMTSREIYLSWAAPDEGTKRRAVVGRGRLVCEDSLTCSIEGLDIIWRQDPAISSNGHFSHRMAFSPDGQYLFISSGDRQQREPAQDLSNNLGTVVRLLPDGTPAPGNPFADQGGVTAQIWSYGHRNLLGLAFDPDGNLWDIEHGPAGGDELNRVRPGANYGWPVVSGGQHYNGNPIPDHDTRPEFAPPAINWTPVIAPGDFTFYTGSLFPDWRGDALIAGLKTIAIIHVAFEGDDAREIARYPMKARLRDIAQGPDGALWVVGDGPGSKLLKLTPKP